MILADDCLVRSQSCLAMEDRKPGPRSITLMSKEAWKDVCDELGADLPWHTRRVNLLVKGIDLPATLGKRVRLGEVRILVHGESKPCELMEKQHRGLRCALKPHCRGGVYGEVLEGGTIRLGDVVCSE